MQGVFANRNEKSDFIINEIERRAEGGCNVYIASAFFTHAEVVERLVAKGCTVFLVVRLGFPTNPQAMDRVAKDPSVQLRIYTGHSYHPKLYIFGDETALVGSANLTRSALMTNQEVVVSVDSTDQRFVELMSIFEDYWDGADVPTEAQMAAYRESYKQYSKHEDEIEALGRTLLGKIGDSSPQNIDRSRPKATKPTIFLANFRRTYQESVAAFNIVRKLYEASGYRKANESDVPLRIEIDSFLSFVRENFARGESWQSGQIRTAAEQGPLIEGLIRKWSETEWPHFENTIVGANYPRLKRLFSSADTIMAADDSQLFDALATLHSFHDRFRFFLGGLPTWKREFPAANEPKRTRESLAYLVFGKGDLVERMANVIYSPRYKLAEFGQANVQELIGWCNREELPIINSRTTKVLRYFGSKVRQL